MRILLSCLFLYPKRVGGAEQFLYNLLEGFIRLGVNDQISLLINKEIECLFPKKYLETYKVIMVNLKNLNRGLYEYFMDFTAWSSVSNYQLIYFPNYITKFKIGNRNLKIVTTIHDFQYLDIPDFFSKIKRLWLYLSHMHTLRAANKVVFISNFVYEKASKFFNIKNINKYTVIHNPIDFGRFEAKVCGCGKYKDIKKILKSNYILTVAAQYPHKNLLVLIKAFKKFNEIKSNKYVLVLVGQLGKNLVGNYSCYYQKLLEEIKNNRYVKITGYLCDYCLSRLYKNCIFFAFPSLYEGFGMPPVEALGFGKPTLVSQVCSLPEITLNEAIYIDEPTSIEDWVNKMIFCINNIDVLNNKFKKLANKFRETYAPENIAKKYWLTFEEVINASKKKSY